jgi:hypothetical protein
MNEEIWFWNQHPSQLERIQYLEHSVPLYLTSSFIEDAEDMRASFAEEKIETSIAVTATQTQMSL